MTCLCPTCNQPLPEGRLVLDTKRRLLIGEDEVARLNGQQLLLLTVLIRDAPRVVPHDRIIMSIWDEGEPEHPDNTVKVLVFRLRRKIQPFGLVIRNVHGGGYALEGPSIMLGELKDFTRRRAA